MGRRAEHALLRRQVGNARRGQGAAVLMVGEPGVGKTALLDDVCGARGMTVLRATGVESEASLGYSVLADLTRPLLHLLELLPGPRAAALSGALALGPVGPPDRFATFAGLLGLLATASERGPLLVCVDDVHWVDEESAEALAFCARRMYAEPILMVLAARDDEDLPFSGAGFERLRITGLDAGSCAELLTAVTGTRPEPAVAERLFTATAGNPLALGELGGLLTTSQLLGRAPIEDPLPVGLGIERLFWRRVARQPVAVQQALLVAATSASGNVSEIATALATFGVGADALEQAEVAGLVTLVEARLEFRHPLLRAAVYRAAAAHERRATHRALAEVVSGPDAPLRRAWHHANGATGPDERIAAELEHAGREMAARTGFAAATSALERAATMSESDQSRARRLLRAAEAAHLAGLFDRARQASRHAVDCSSDPELIADCAHLRATVELYAGNVLDAHRVLVDAAARIAPYDPAREAQLLTDAALPLINAGDIAAADEVAHRAHRLAQEVGGETEVLCRKLLGVSMVLHGEAPRGYELMLDGLDLEVSARAMLTPKLLAQWGMLCSVWVEDYDRAREIAAAVLPTIRSAGALTPLPYVLAVLSELEFRTGNWRAALAAASEAASIARETGQGGTRAYSFVSLARVEAGMGQEGPCREHVDEAQACAARAGTRSISTYAQAALGLLELGLSRLENARSELEPLPEVTLSQGLAEPSVVCWQPDWIETNIRIGDLDTAVQALTRFEREAASVNRTWALAAADRCRGLVAADDEFEGHFERAFARYAHTLAPFERARTELCFGERLRRVGERRRAREQLARALHTFRGLRASPWAARAETELAAAGASPARSTHSLSGRGPQEVLTNQELQVALAIADGKSNKEAAAALFLSPKTIEFHLGHIYRKLGIRSRTQLAREMLGPVAQAPDLSGAQGRR